MEALIRHRKRIAALIGIFALLPAWWISAPVRGYAVACFDVLRGHYEVQSYGYPAEWRPEYARRLRNRYGIKHRTVAGCVASPWLHAYVTAYNAVSRAAAQRKYGRDVFAECAADARTAWEKQHHAETEPK